MRDASVVSRALYSQLTVANLEWSSINSLPLDKTILAAWQFLALRRNIGASKFLFRFERSGTRTASNVTRIHETRIMRLSRLIACEHIPKDLYAEVIAPLSMVVSAIINSRGDFRGTFFS